MTTLDARPNSALLVIDVQNQVMDGAHERDAVIANVATLVDKARAAHVPLVWVQHSSDELVHGTPGWHYVAELDPQGDEPLVHKRYPDECIRSTLHGAIVRGYDATLVEDAHTTEDASEWGAPPPDKVIAHTNLYWKYHAAPGRTAGTVTTGAVDFG